MMTFEEVKSVVESITYKPDTSFSVYTDEYQDVYYLIVYKQVVDVNTGKPIHLRRSVPIPTDCFTGAEYVKQEMYEIVEAMEIHELKEWFKVNGKQLYDPHPERAPKQAHANRIYNSRFNKRERSSRANKVA